MTVVTIVYLTTVHPSVMSHEIQTYLNTSHREMSLI